MLIRPILILAVVHGESGLPQRLEGLGFVVSTVGPAWLESPRQTQAGAAVIEAQRPTSGLWPLLHRAAAILPAVAVTDDVPALEAHWTGSEAPPFAAVSPAAADSHLEMAVLTACRLHSEFTERKAADAELRRIRDLASRVSIGLFRFQTASSGRVAIEYLSMRARQLLDMSEARLTTNPQLWYHIMLPEDREAYRSFLEHHQSSGSPGKIRVRMFVRGQVRTILLRFDEPHPTADGYSLQGIIEDVTDETLRAGYGDRALELLRGLRENLLFLDLVEPAPPPPGGAFSKREQEVFQLLRAGLSNSQIGLRLRCSESTVKKHVSSIYEKAGVHTRAQLLTVDWTTT